MTMYHLVTNVENDKIIGALGSVPKSLCKWIDKLGIKIKTKFLQKTALVGTTRILRKVLES